MAQQHFFSRVPARMSVYNRADGYDTFGKSEGISDEFIKKELSIVCDTTVTKAESAVIRTGDIQPAYCQYTVKSGEMVQSCVSLLPLDYTGERSSYLVHSYVFSAEEKAALLGEMDHVSVDAARFITDTASFRLTDAESAPDVNIPDLKVNGVAPSITTSQLIKKYDPAMIRRLIYSMLNVVCGKGKCVYVSLPGKLRECSENALNFMQSLLMIFPAVLREKLSFVTYCGDISKYNGVKVKFIPEDMPPVPVQKGDSLRFGARVTIGVSEEAINANRSLIDFFYSMLDNETVRREFFIYMRDAVATQPEITNMNMKVLTDIVGLFLQCSGLYKEAVILPSDESVLNFVQSYEKYRVCLKDGYRTNALKCLWRYPNKHIPIPKMVMSKVSKLYAGETEVSKRTIMNIMLELIHTDAMRDKLFAFIKSNYAGETDEMKDVIVEHLSRVYYGAFLMPQILEFFDKIFDKTSDVGKDLILDKLLLTIRTESVQNSVIDFISGHYECMNDGQKEKVYAVYFEMLSVGDELSKKLTDMLSVKLNGETPERQNAVGEKLLKMVDNDQRRKEPKLLAMLMEVEGFCGNLVVAKLLTDWSGRKICENFWNAMAVKELPAMIDSIIGVFNFNGGLKGDAKDRALDRVKKIFNGSVSGMNLYALIDAENSLNERMTDKDMAKELNKAVICPKVQDYLGEAFNVKLRKNGPEFMLTYADTHPQVKNGQDWLVLSAYEKALNDAANGRPEPFAEAVENCKPALRGGFAECLKIAISENDKYGDADCDTVRLLSQLYPGLVRSGKLKFAAPYNALRDAVVGRVDNSNAKAVAEANEQALEKLITVAQILWKYHPDEVCATDNELSVCVGAFIGKFEGKGAKRVAELLKTMNLSDTDLGGAILAAAKNAPGKKKSKSAGGGVKLPSLLGKFFKKKS